MSATASAASIQLLFGSNSGTFDPNSSPGSERRRQLQLRRRERKHVPASTHSDRPR